MDTLTPVQDTTATRKRFLRRAQVEDMTGLACTTIYRKMSEGAFPRPVHLSRSSVRWIEADVLAWMDRISCGDASGAA
jgi:prophage regulatory protein